MEVKHLMLFCIIISLGVTADDDLAIGDTASPNDLEGRAARARTQYEVHMNEEVGESLPAVPESALMKFHDKIYHEALDTFANEKTRHNKDVKHRWKTLQTELQSLLRNYLTSNKNKTMSALHDAEESYQAHVRTFHKDDSLCMIPKDLQQVHVKAVEAGLKRFNKNRRKIDGADDVEELVCRYKLEEKIMELEESNNKNNLKAVNTVLYEFYTVGLGMHLEDNPPMSEEGFQNLHEEAYQKAKERLDEKRNIISNNTEDDPFKITLYGRVLETYSNLKMINYYHNVQFRQIAYNRFKDRMFYYWDSKKSHYKCVSPKALDLRYGLYKDDAIRVLRNGTCSDRECLLLSGMIDSHYKEVKDINMKANEVFVEKILVYLKEMMSASCSAMYRSNGNETLEHCQANAKKAALDVFATLRHFENEDDYYKSIETRMDEVITQFSNLV